MSISKHPLAKALLPLAIASVFSTQAMAAPTDQEIDALWQTIEELQQQVAEAAEWKAPNTLIHMAGYADVNFVSVENSNGDGSNSFSTASFAPIFHYQYKNSVMLETELAFSVNELGETEVEMEYFTIDYVLNDNAILVMGRFLSPLGQFRQNFHPSWINKLPSAPQGFGHGGAAPIADVGAQLRGGFKIGSSISANYAAYIGNGVAAEMSAADNDDLEEAHSPGFNADQDGNKNIGGRFGIYMPDNKLDLGLSWATGKAGEIYNPDAAPDLSANDFNVKRDWDFIGADFTWHMGGLDIRGEYLKQSYGARGASATADFDASYIQVAYRFPSTKWEVVARTSTYTNPEGTLDRSTAGVNYIFNSNIVAKAAFESNSNDANTAEDRMLVQMAYGF